MNDRMLIIQIRINMKVAVWDTYVPKEDGKIMHFDIIAPDEMRDTMTIYKYGKEYLKSKNQEGKELSSKECEFCHIESASAEMIKGIKEKGYYIIEMENCN